jgi:hypothetical protein
MPATSEKQARFMRAELGRAKRGQQTKTGMSAGKLKEFTHTTGEPPAAGYAHLGRFASGKAKTVNAPPAPPVSTANRHHQ